MLAWLRQGRKSSTLGKQSLREMAAHPGRLITFATASLNLGGEMPQKEGTLWQEFLTDMRLWAEKKKCLLVAGERRHESDDHSWRQFADDIDVDAIADVLVHNKFEVRLKHSNSVSSKLKVIAANVRTARGWSGSVKLDEAPFVEGLKDLIAELEPIFSTDPTFNFLMAGTPHPDYADFSYELFMEENGREDWPVNPKGNWFKNRIGWWVHRVTIDDAAAAGRKNYHPETGEEITPDEARAASSDQEGWDRSNRLLRPKVGRSAISPMAMTTAQQKGRTRCFASEWPADMEELPAGALEHVKGVVTIGVDPATTEKETSNPTGLAIQRKEGQDIHIPTILWWKTADPRIQRKRMVLIVRTLLNMGVQVKCVGIDATNERGLAREIRDDLTALTTVILLIGSENVEGVKDTDGFNINVKQHKGNLLSAAGESERLIVASHRYVYGDWMRVVKKKGTYDAAVGSAGEHGDTFDAAANAMFVDEVGGPVEVHFPQIGDLATGGTDDDDDEDWFDKMKRAAKNLFHA